MRQIKQKNGMKRSPSGFYSFRKQVPEHLRILWGKREVKIKLETKDEATALSRCAVVLAEFNATQMRLTKLIEGSTDITPQEIRSIADSRVRDWGIHPDQVPTLQAGHSDAEYEAFKQAERTYLERKDIYYDLAADNLIDEEKRQRDYQSGRWAKPNYKTPYKAQSTTTVEAASDGIVTGQIITTMTPTLRDALASPIQTRGIILKRRTG